MFTLIAILFAVWLAWRLWRKLASYIRKHHKALAWQLTLEDF